ncbi:MAG: hypothetical protein RLN62_06555 [Rickettsiales bacterium]
MISNIVKIGNSKGLRIPKAILEQCDFQDKVKIEISNNTMIVRPLKPRSHWDESFKNTQLEEEKVEMLPTKWDEEEWEW